MKRNHLTAFLILAALLLPFTVMAQVSVGLKVGYTASGLATGLDSIKASMLSGFHAGGFLRIGNKVHLQPEMYYTISGGTFENLGQGTGNDWKQKIRVGTLDIPVLVGISIYRAKYFKWRIMAGPQASFVVNSNVKDLNLTGPVTGADLSKINWFLQVGTGFDLAFLTLDLRYQAGLNILIGDVTGRHNEGYRVNARSNLFLASLGFKFF